jgi:biotin synthase-like enzyme
MQEGMPFLDEVKILPTLAHAPNQAFINLSSRCVYDCAFCAVPDLEKDYTRLMNPERAVRIFKIASEQSGFIGVAITSGIPDTPQETNERICEIIRLTRQRMGDIPIGVEPYIEDVEDVRKLKDAGADEIKINIEVWDEDLFTKMCPKRDRNLILQVMREAVEVFGKGKVCANLIVGLGETDKDVEDGVRTLAKMGVTVNIRAVRISKYNEDKLFKILNFRPNRVNTERLISLAQMHKEVLRENGLTTLSFKTMCFSCQCCDIVPFRDL